MSEWMKLIRAASWGVVIFITIVKHSDAAACVALVLAVMVCGVDVSAWTWQLARKVWDDWISPRKRGK